MSGSNYRFANGLHEYCASILNFYREDIRHVNWSEWAWMLLLLSVVCYLFPITYFLTSLQARFAIQNTTAGRRPPTAPYWVPFFGHLVPFLVDLDSLLAAIVWVLNSRRVPRRWHHARNRFGTSHPIRINLGIEEVFLVAGAQNLKTVWKNSQWLTAKAGHLIGLYTILDTPKRSLDFYRADSSGIGKKPLPHSNVLPEHRVWHLTHQPIIDCLSGAKLNLLSKEFQDCMARRIEQCQIGHEWIDMPDLYTFIYSEIIQVQLELLCGTLFLEHNPNFVQDFKSFNRAMIHLRRGLPRWMTPGSCRTRDACLRSVKKWHEALKVHDPNRLVDTGEIQSPRFGNEMMRLRQRIMAKMGAMDEDAAASADLGMLWAWVPPYRFTGSLQLARRTMLEAHFICFDTDRWYRLNANPATATFWLLFEIVRDPSLHPAIFHAIDASICPPPNSCTLHDVTKLRTSKSKSPHLSNQLLNDSPLLQSMYAETLRLRISILAIQSAEFGAFNFNQWVFPKDRLILISSRIAHMDKFWNSGRHGERPVDEFWAERFLVWNDKPTQNAAPVEPLAKNHTEVRGSCKPSGIMPSDRCSYTAQRRDATAYEKARFSMAGLAGMWVPYGGGPGICPGRHFAKNVMLLASALMFYTFDMELMQGEEPRPAMDMRYYGLGALPPKGAIPFRIRRRADGKWVAVN